MDTEDTTAAADGEAAPEGAVTPQDDTASPVESTTAEQGQAADPDEGAPTAAATADPSDGAPAPADEPVEAVEAVETVEIVSAPPYEGRSREEVLTEIEAVAATPDVDEHGKQPDDRALADRLKALDAEWSAAPEGEAAAEKDLRRRLDAARKAHALARSRRAESRAVQRARAGETKRGLLVEAFTLARTVDPAGVQVPTPNAPAPVAARPPRRLAALHPSPAMFARRVPAAVLEGVKVTAPDPAPETDAPEPTDAVEPPLPVTDDTPSAELEQPALFVTEEPAEPVLDPADTLADEPSAEVTADDDETRSAEALAVQEDAESTEPAEPIEPAEPAEPAEPDAPVAEPDAPVAEPELDLVALAAQAQRLQTEWREAGFAGKETEDEIAPLFRSYLDVVFTAARQVSSGRIKGRKELVKEARALAARAGQAEPKEITALVREAKALQERWKQGEAAPRGPENTSWQQFSGALREVFTVREATQGSAIAERQEIVAAVAALTQGRDAFRAVKEVGGLLKRWGAAGPVPGKVYAELKAKLDADLTAIRSRADAERKRRDAEDERSQAERAKHASRLVREAERGRKQRGDGPTRPAGGGGGEGGALAAALAAAFGRTDTVAREVAELEAAVSELEARLAAGQREIADHRAETEQGWSVQARVDRSAFDPAKVSKQLEVARTALERRRADLAALESTAGTLGVR